MPIHCVKRSTNKRLHVHPIVENCDASHPFENYLISNSIEYALMSQFMNKTANCNKIGRGKFFGVSSSAYCYFSLYTLK